MPIKKVDLETKPLEEKIEELFSFTKDKLINSGKVPNIIYLFDNHDKMYSLDVSERDLLSNTDAKNYLFKAIIKNVIGEIEHKNACIINYVLSFTALTVSPHIKNKYNFDEDSTEPGALDVVIMSLEDKFNIKMDFYDAIKGEDSVLLSQKPLNKINYCKLDPDQEVKGSLINLL